MHIVQNKPNKRISINITRLRYMIHILELSERGIGAIIFIIVSLFLCFFVGKLFLNNTQNMLINILSLLPLAIIIAVTLYISYGNPSSYGNILVVPIYTLSEIISYFFRIEAKYSYLIMSLLPPLVMWVGLITKRT